MVVNKFNILLSSGLVALAGCATQPPPQWHSLNKKTYSLKDSVPGDGLSADLTTKRRWVVGFRWVWPAWVASIFRWAFWNADHKTCWGAVSAEQRKYLRQHS